MSVACYGEIVAVGSSAHSTGQGHPTHRQQVKITLHRQNNQGHPKHRQQVKVTLYTGNRSWSPYTGNRPRSPYMHATGQGPTKRPGHPKHRQQVKVTFTHMQPDKVTLHKGKKQTKMLIVLLQLVKACRQHEQPLKLLLNLTAQKTSPRSWSACTFALLLL